MLGMDRHTGKPLGGDDHLAQSIGDILLTPLGSRVGRRDYGSLLPELVDQAMNAAGRLRLFAASAIAIARWEPRLRITGFHLEPGGAGSATLVIDGHRLDGARGNARTRLLVALRTA